MRMLLVVLSLVLHLFYLRYVVLYILSPFLFCFSFTRENLYACNYRRSRRQERTKIKQARIKRVSYRFFFFFFFKFSLESLPLFGRVIKTLLIVHPSLLFVCCLSISVLVVVLFTVHCKMDSSPIVTTHTNNKSKSSRKSLISPSKISSKSLNPEGTRRRKPLSPRDPQSLRDTFHSLKLEHHTFALFLFSFLPLLLSLSLSLSFSFFSLTLSLSFPFCFFSSFP